MPDPTPPIRIAGHTDTRENLIEAINGLQSLSDAGKAHLVDIINTNHAGARLLRLDYHVHVGTAAGKRKTIGTFAITEI